MALLKIQQERCDRLKYTARIKEKYRVKRTIINKRIKEDPGCLGDSVG